MFSFYFYHIDSSLQHIFTKTYLHHNNSFASRTLPAFGCRSFGANATPPHSRHWFAGSTLAPSSGRLLESPHAPA